MPTMSASRAIEELLRPVEVAHRICTEPRPCATWESEPAPPTIRYLAAKRTASSLLAGSAMRGLKTSMASMSSTMASRCS